VINLSLAVKGKKSDQGFTLIELLIAISIFAILSVVAYSALNNVLESQRYLKEKSDKLASVQRMLSRFGRDFEQSAPRSIRDAFGDVQPAWHRQADILEDADTLLEFTLGGRASLQGDKRITMQRVAYAVREDGLIRASWPVLDRAENVAPYQVEVYKDIKNLTIRMLDSQGSFQQDWPLEAVNDAPVEVLPRAVEITFEVDDWGTIRRLYRVAG